MRRYTAADEERIRTETCARNWMDSGLLEPRQHAAIEADLHTDLKRTNLSLRVVLFIFGSIVLLAALGLVFRFSSSFRDVRSIGWPMVTVGVSGFLLADVLVSRFRLYRFGVEEAFASWSAVLIGFGVGSLVSAGGSRGEFPILVGLLVAAIVSLAIYARFGYRYAALGGVACAACAPFFLAQSQVTERLVSASVLLAAFAAARSLERPLGEDFPGDDYHAIQSVAWLGFYLVLNLGLSRDVAPFFGSGRAEVPSSVYWGTYVAVWVVPAAGLYLGLVHKHRGLIVTSLLMAVLTLITNKTYLGWERHTWDPILLGLLLVGASMAIRRWLSHGPGGQRHGFAAESLLASDRRSLAALGTVAGMVQPIGGRETTSTSTFDPGRGGRSGGGGGGADF
jgi:hypothetical protein